MAFFKPSADPVSNKNVARLQTLIWVLLYGGLLTLVLGLSVQRQDDAIGWSMVVLGAVVAAIGAALIYVRSRINVSP
ncbi:MAG: hypothetical protein ABI893_09020 [Polaromonas sp.]|uniref:hypothetical protein n=1 Tax=Polaromonas sp. TaxID=1869339 RepID=UPI00326660DF